MKKIGILTLTGDNNYGNKLQNYAMEYIFREIGFSVETIRISRLPYHKLVFRTYLQNCFLFCLSDKRRMKIKRRMKFLSFNKKITRSKMHINPNEQESNIKKKLENFDYLVYGSDQIWNPELPTFSEIYLGKYARPQKNIAVSASLGIASIPDEFKEVFECGLLRFQAISVREEAGKNAIQNLAGGFDVEVLIDPTLMLASNQWQKIEKKVAISSEYVLIYFLGKYESAFIEQLLKDNDSKRLDAGSKQPYGPDEFIYLVRNAEVVVTDSFHASAFSIIFGKEVYIIRREDRYSSMESRIDTLVEKVGVSYEKSNEYIRIKRNAILEKEAKEKMADEKGKFIHYIERNFTINNPNSSDKGD